jgi:signal transduction histidine kinase/ligand-binding sensor domain-containing protein
MFSPKSILLFVAWLLPRLLVAQSAFGDYYLEQWNVAKGLPTDLVLNIHKDHEGYLWLSGYDGLIKFDGQRFKVFTANEYPELITNSSYGVFVDRRKDQWIPIVNNTILRYSQGKFKPYESPWVIGRPEVVLERDGLLFESSGKMFVHFDFAKKQFKALDEKKLIDLLRSYADQRNIVKDQKEQLLFVSERRLYKIENNQRIEINNNPSTDSKKIVNSELFKDSRGQIHLISDPGHRIWNGVQFVPVPGTEHLRFQTFGGSRKPLIVEDLDQNLWIASIQGLVLRRKGSNKYEFLPPSHPLNAFFINAMLVDKENNLWLATESGLYKLSAGKLRVYSIYDGLTSKKVTAVAALDTDRYLLNTPGTQNFHVLEKGQLKSFKFDREPNQVIEIFHSMTDSRKRTWLATAGVLIVLEPNKNNQIFYINENIRMVYEGRDGQIYLGIGSKGIGRWIGSGIEMLTFPGLDFQDLAVSSIQQNPKGGWGIGTFNLGILLIDAQNRVKHLYDTLGFPPIGVFNLHFEPDGTCFLPTTLGLYYWNGARCIKMQDEKGFLNYSIFDIIQDKLGNFWLPSNQGIVKISKAELLAYAGSNLPKPLKAVCFDESDGMLSRQCIGARHSTLAPDGKVLVTTYQGLVEIDPSNNTFNKVKPLVSIDPLQVDGKTVATDLLKQLAPGNHQYVFSYGALSTTAPSKVRYRYRLDGYKNTWSEPTAEDRIVYTNLPAGHYTFRVKAANNDGVWSEKEAILALVIRPFFYQTWWFWSLFALALLLGIQQYIRFRNRSLLTKNEDLERNVAQRTQELSQANEHLNQQKNSLEDTLQRLQSTQGQLIQSEKLASLGELTAGIAHEIQNPLNFVNNFAEVSAELLAEMSQELDNGDTAEAKIIAADVTQNLQKISHHGHRASSIVKSMLDHSRSNTGQKEPTDLNQMADEYLRLAYHGLRAKNNSFNCTLEANLDPNLPKAKVIPQDMGRVLLNLINNAFYAVQDKAKMGIEGYEPKVSVSSALVGDKVEIRVQDNGNGIPEGIREKIFQPFFTTKPTGQGTGLGLSLAYDIVVKGHGGTLEAKSTDGLGSVFLLILPILPL